MNVVIDVVITSRSVKLGGKLKTLWGREFPSMTRLNTAADL